MKNTQGSVLLGSLMLLTVLSMVLIGTDSPNSGGSGFMQTVTQEHLWVQRDYANVTALNLAEAGLEQALDDISKTWSSGLGYNKTEIFSLGNYSVQTTASTSSSYTLLATGTVPLGDLIVIRKVQLTIHKEGIDVPYVILTNGNLNLKQANATIHGVSSTVFHTNGNLHYDGAVEVFTQNEAEETIYGGVSASGNITGNGTLTTSQATANAPTVNLPTVNFDQLKSEAATQVNGNYELNGGSLGASGSVTYIDGNLTLSGNVTVKGILVVDGNMDITGTVKPPTGETLEIITKGNVDFDDQNASSSTAELVASIYCEGNFKLQPGSPWIQGFIIATGNMEFTAANAGSLKIEYQANQDSRLTTIKTSVADWKEVY